MPSHAARWRRALLCGALAVVVLGGSRAPVDAKPKRRHAAVASASAGPSPDVASAAPTSSSAPTAPAASSEPPPGDAGHAPDPANRAKPPLTSDDLDARAAHLFDAIAQGKPELADDFFFPLAPFVPLKDVADPARYHKQLVATYHRDVLELHRRHASWEGGRFVSFALGSPPTWVAPGEEWNKVGYHRTFRATLAYELGGRRRSLTVMTIISWDGRWYVTHLAPIKH